MRGTRRQQMVERRLTNGRPLAVTAGWLDVRRKWPRSPWQPGPHCLLSAVEWQQQRARAPFSSSSAPSIPVPSPHPATLHGGIGLGHVAGQRAQQRDAVLSSGHGVGSGGCRQQDGRQQRSRGTWGPTQN